MQADLKILFAISLFDMPKKMQIAVLALKLHRIFEWHYDCEEKLLAKFLDFINMDESAGYGFTEGLKHNILCAAASVTEGVDMIAMFSMLYSESNPMKPCPLTAAAIFNEMQNQCYRHISLFDRHMDSINYQLLFQKKDYFECRKMSMRIDEIVTQFCGQVMPDLSINFTPYIEFQHETWDSCCEIGSRQWEGIFIVPDVGQLNSYTQVLSRVNLYA